MHGEQTRHENIRSWTLPPESHTKKIGHDVIRDHAPETRLKGARFKLAKPRGKPNVNREVKL